MSDYWSPYEKFIPTELHTQSKAETYAVEGYNSLFRHFLARLRRKSKCYSKSQEMLKYSVLLLMLKWNGELGTILTEQCQISNMIVTWDLRQSKQGVGIIASFGELQCPLCVQKGRALCKEYRKRPHCGVRHGIHGIIPGAGVGKLLANQT